MHHNSSLMLAFVLSIILVSRAHSRQQERGFIPPDLLPDTSLYHIVPQGVILLWSGPVHLVPNGWAVCDGTQGTPDLRDRFVIGTGSNAQYSVGQRGGASTAAPIITVHPTRLTIAQMPEHSHGGVTYWEEVDTICSKDEITANQKNVTQRTIQSDKSTMIDTTRYHHRHTIEQQGNGEAHIHEATSNSIHTIPPFHALIYIMKT